MSSNNSNLNKRRSGSVCGLNRSRHCSANSAKSCVSFDSAIGDVYSVQTPTKSSSNGGNGNGSNFSGNNNELDIFDFSSGSTSSSPTLGTNSASVTATASAGLQFDTLAASVCFDSGEPSADLLDFDTNQDCVDGLGG